MEPNKQRILLLLSRFSSVRLCATPQTAAHQAPPSLGFFRQEHWSGLSFPSPMHESEKWKWSRSVVSDSLWPHGLQPTRLLCPWDFPGKSTGVGCHCLLKDQKYKGQGVRRKGSDRTIITLLYQEKCGIKARLDAFFLSRFWIVKKEKGRKCIHATFISCFSICVATD